MLVGEVKVAVEVGGSDGLDGEEGGGWGREGEKTIKTKVAKKKPKTFMIHDIFSFVRWQQWWLRLLVRLLMVVVVPLFLRTRMSPPR